MKRLSDLDIQTSFNNKLISGQRAGLTLPSHKIENLVQDLYIPIYPSSNYNIEDIIPENKENNNFFAGIDDVKNAALNSLKSIASGTGNILSSLFSGLLGNWQYILIALIILIPGYYIFIKK